MEEFISHLYQEYSDTLIYIIKNRLYTGCPKYYAYDCLNDVFVIAIQKHNDSSFQTNPKGWLIRTARNVVDNFNRKSFRRNNYADYSQDIREIPQLQDMEEECVYKEWLTNHFQTELNESLSNEEKFLYYLRYKKKLNNEEISQQLGISKNAVNTRLSRLRQKIRQFIRENIS